MIPIGDHQMIFHYYFLIHNIFQLLNVPQAFLFNVPPTIYEIYEL
jgi:hypothetical protein